MFYLSSAPRHARHVSLALSGALGPTARSDLAHALTLTSLVGRRRMLLDLGAVTSIDPATLQVIEQTAADAVRDGGVVVLVLPKGDALGPVRAALSASAVLACAPTRAAACGLLACDGATLDAPDQPGASDGSSDALDAAPARALGRVRRLPSRRTRSLTTPPLTPPTPLLGAPR